MFLFKAAAIQTLLEKYMHAETRAVAKGGGIGGGGGGG